jgi:hypothetical protein
MWQKHNETGQLVMMLQEEIKFDDYFRCYSIGCSEVRIMPYNPLNPHETRYNASIQAKGEEAKKLLSTIEDYVLRLNIALGYDFNTVEFAVRDGIPYAIDFCNPAPDADFLLIKSMIRKTQGSTPALYGTLRFHQDSTADYILQPPKMLRKFEFKPIDGLQDISKSKLAKAKKRKAGLQL